MSPAHASDCSCPEERCTITRRAKLHTIYSSEEWARNRAAFLGITLPPIVKGITEGEGLQVGEAGNLAFLGTYWYDRKRPCEDHLKPSVKHPEGIVIKDGVLPHHPDPDSYKNGEYPDLDSCGCKVNCPACHYAHHHNLELCPVCGERYMERGSDMCRTCYNEKHPEEKEKHDTNVAAFKEGIRQFNKNRAQRTRTERIKHPCAFRISGQRCRLGGACEHSPAKAAAQCKQGYKQKKNWKGKGVMRS
jgi:hypothetical protein